MSYKSFAFLLMMMPTVSWSQTPYVVQPGDTILKVADRSLGNKDRSNPRRYELARKIRQLNPGLKDPNQLEPGQTLILPEAPSKGKSPSSVAQPLVAEAPKPSEEKEAATPAVAQVTPPASTEAHHAPVAEAPASPAQETHPAEPESHEAGHSDFIFVQPRYQVLEITSTDLATKTKASMKSKSSVGLDVQYGKILNHHFHLLFQAGIVQTQFENIEGAGATVNHTSETLKYFAAGIAYEATSNLHMDLMLMSAERTFLVPTTLPAYELKAIMVPGAELNISYDFYSGASNIFGISAIGEYLSKVEKDSVVYKSALEPLAALYWKSKYGPDSINYKATLTYKHGHQDTSVSQQNEDLTVLGVGFYF